MQLTQKSAQIMQVHQLIIQMCCFTCATFFEQMSFQSLTEDVEQTLRIVHTDHMIVL